MAWYHEPFMRRPRPYGGDGGRGGDIIAKVASNYNSLDHIKVHWKAPNGGHGGRNGKTGVSIEPLEILVPPGTTVRDSSGELVADLVEEGQVHSLCVSDHTLQLGPFLG